MTEDNSSEREAFEKCFKSRYPDADFEISEYNDEYIVDSLQDLWEGWQARSLTQQPDVEKVAKTLWQEIWTAPRDGRWIQIFNIGVGVPVSVRWDEPRRSWVDVSAHSAIGHYWTPLLTPPEGHELPLQNQAAIASMVEPSSHVVQQGVVELEAIQGDNETLIRQCPECGSGDIRWCGISVRPYCGECSYWGPVNLGSQGQAVARHNAALTSLQLANVQWLPIESAPKDGTYILIYSKDDAWGEPCMATCKWENGWWEPIDSNPIHDPTHWMPLPNPPTANTDAP